MFVEYYTSCPRFVHGIHARHASLPGIRSSLVLYDAQVPLGTLSSGYTLSSYRFCRACGSVSALVITSTLRHRQRFKKRLQHAALPDESKDSPSSEEGNEIKEFSWWNFEPLDEYVQIAARFLLGKVQSIFDELNIFMEWVEATWQGITRPVFDIVFWVNVRYNEWVYKQRQKLQPVLEQLLEITQPLFDSLCQLQKWITNTFIWKWFEGKLRETSRPLIDQFNQTREKVYRKYREIARPVFDEFDLDGNGELDVKEVYAALCFIVATLNTTALSIDPPKLQFVRTLMKDESRPIQFDEFLDVLVAFSKNLSVRAVAKATVNALIPLVAFTVARNAQRLFPGDDAFGLPRWFFEGLIFVVASIFCYFYLLPGMYPSVDALSIDATTDLRRARAPNQPMQK